MGFLTSSRSVYVLIIIIIIEVVSVGHLYFYHKPTSEITPKRSRRFLSKSYTELHGHNGYNVTGVKSWENGMATLLQPMIKANFTALRTGDEREVRTAKKRVQDPGRYLPKLYAAPHGHSGCNITSVKSWENGMVTLLQPMIEANCTALTTGNETEVRSVKKRIETWVNTESDGEFLKTLYNCSHIVEEYSNNFYVSAEEENFPLAYILVVHNNVRQVLRLLKVIYRPHNLYCIHPDAKEPNLVEQFMTLSHCFVNTFVASKLEKVYYNHHSIMDAQLNCMQDLMRFGPSRWRYTINLSGQELPLKTNREIVHIMFKLNGSSAVDSHEVPQTDRYRFANKAVLSGGVLRQTKEKLGPVPYGIKIYKANNYIATARSFVSFLLTNKISIALRKYLRDVIVPEEHFYATIYKLPDVPGGPPKDPSVKTDVATCVWMTSQYAHQHRQELCKGKIVHDLCVISSGDLPTVYRIGVNAPTPILFFNKYFNSLDHVVMDCMEQWLVEQNWLEYKHDCLV